MANTDTQDTFTVQLLRMYKWRRVKYRLDPGGVRTLIAWHHGRKTKSELFASSRGRVNISGDSEMA